MHLPFQSIAASPGPSTGGRPRSCLLSLLAALGFALAGPAPAIASQHIASPGAGAAAPTVPGPRRKADFAGAAASADTQLVADWIVRSGDNQGLSFIVVDKAHAQLFLFDAGGTIRADTPVLLGLGVGDDSPPDIGSKKLSAMTPGEQITPSGRFVAGRGLNLAGQDILWVDYEAAVSLHRASDRKPGMTSKSRTDRLASATTLDNRASHGCINVSVPFYDDFIRPAFEGTAGIVYVLPETRSARDEFNIPA